MKNQQTTKHGAVLAGAVALLLISAGFGGLAWAITRGEPTAECPTGNITINQFAGFSHCLGRTEAGVGAEKNPVYSRGFSAVRAAPYVVEALAKQGKTIKEPFPNSANHGKKFNPQGEVIGPLTTDPVQKVLVVFVEFTTLPPGGPATRLDLHYFDDLLFGTVYDPPEYAPYPGHPTDRTLRNYYEEVSYGKVDVVTLNLPSTLGWAQVGKPYEYYCRADGVHDYGDGPYPENPQGLVIDAIKAVDPVVDFSQYAINGEVPNLFVVHTGTGAEENGDPSIIWSHQWWLSDGTGLDGYWADGVKIDTYAMLPEVRGDLTGFMGLGIMGPFPPTVGTYAHEYGHVLGLPDQYDYGYESDGTGNYSLMAGGNWCFWYPNPTFPDYFMFFGNSPVHFDAWSKYRLGFVTPVEVDPSVAVSVVLDPVEATPIVYRMDVPNSGGKEYFLLENRQQIGFDQGLAFVSRPFQEMLPPGGHGLAIWHIDDTVLTRNYWRPNEAQNWKKFRSEGWRKAWTGETHYGISIIQADDRWDLERIVSWGADAADLYPGALGITRFGDDTYPNSSSYYFWPGSAPRFGLSKVTVNNIAEVDGVIMAVLSFAR
jgi:M6 family metalloprotease-like protein